MGHQVVSALRRVIPGTTWTFTVGWWTWDPYCGMVDVGTMTRGWWTWGLCCGTVDTGTFICDSGHRDLYLELWTWQGIRPPEQLHATLDPVKCLLLSLSPASVGISLS